MLMENYVVFAIDKRLHGEQTSVTKTCFKQRKAARYALTVKQTQAVPKNE